MRRALAAAGLALVAALAGAAPAAGAAACADDSAHPAGVHPGGDWRF
jgi:hypothetical protein